MKTKNIIGDFKKAIDQNREGKTQPTLEDVIDDLLDECKTLRDQIWHKDQRIADLEEQLGQALRDIETLVEENNKLRKPYKNMIRMSPETKEVMKRMGIDFDKKGESAKTPANTGSEQKT
jgi:predicted  nucleic acid-binding Zn-ribbon protein